MIEYSVRYNVMSLRYECTQHKKHTRPIKLFMLLLQLQHTTYNIRCVVVIKATRLQTCTME